MIEPSSILDALASVRDPELDTSIVELGFVTACWLDEVGTARHPTPPAHLLLRPELRVPDGVRRPCSRRRHRWRRGGGHLARGPLRLRRDQHRRGRPSRVRRLVRRSRRARARRAPPNLPAQGGARCAGSRPPSVARRRRRAPGARRPPVGDCRRLRLFLPSSEPDVSSWGSHPPTPTRCSCTSATVRRSLMERSASTFVAPAPWA